WDAQARERAGEKLDLWHAADIPSPLRGYVGVALENGLIGLAGGTLPVFKAQGSITRLEAARYLLRVFDLRRDPEAPLPEAPSPTRSSPGGGKSGGAGKP